MIADGSWGVKVTERATRAAVQNATVVKKPKVFCNLTNDECILMAAKDNDHKVYVAV